MSKTVAYYSPKEEFLNIWSHAIAAGAAVIAGVFLLMKSLLFSPVYIVSMGVFAASMVCLFLVSSLYHAAENEERRARFRVFDHCAIFVFIAGTYTPFSLLVLKGSIGWWIFGISWCLAVIGIALKIWFTGQFKILSTSIYVFMGWIIIFVGKTLVESFSAEGFFWLAAGGVVYTLGAVVYLLKQVHYSHAIFHIFVVFGAACHFYSAYQYILV